MNSAQKSENSYLSKRARSGVYWYVLNAMGSQGARFLTSIILARLLYPEDFGIMGLVFVVVRLAQRVGEFGFAQVIVQLKRLTDDHIKTAFTLNFILSAVIAVIIFGLAPVFSGWVLRTTDAHLLPTVTAILRVISINFILSAMYTVPMAILKREMKFKEDSLVSLSASMTGFLVPIPLAFMGCGVWSIVAGHVIGQFVQVAGFYRLTRWKPRFGISRVVSAEIVRFGTWMNVYSYINYAINNVDYFLISKVLGAAQLGYYERAFNLMNAPRKRINSMLNTVLLSTYSRIQDEQERFNLAFNKVMKTVSLISFPIMVWLFFISPSFITVLYGPRWEATILPTQIMCISGLLSSIAMVFNPAFVAKGLVKQRTLAYFITLIVLAAGILTGVQKGIAFVAAAVSLSAVVSLTVNSILFSRSTGWKLTLLWHNLKTASGLAVFIAVLLLVNRWLWGFYVPDTSPLVLVSASALTLLGYVGAAYTLKSRDMQELLYEAFGGIIDRFHKRDKTIHPS